MKRELTLKAKFLFFVGATSLVVSTVSLSGCARVTNTGTGLLTAVSSEPIPVQSGYNGNEKFCGTLGKIQYVAIKQQVHFNFNLSAAKANRQYLIDWQNNNVRGYAVGVFSTDHSGAIRKGSLRMYRPGEVRGIGLMIYYLNRFTPVGMQHFKPC